MESWAEGGWGSSLAGGPAPEGLEGERKWDPAPRRPGLRSGCLARGSGGREAPEVTDSCGPGQGSWCRMRERVDTEAGLGRGLCRTVEACGD